MINDAEENKTKRNLMGPVLAALFAAFISVAAFFHIPLPGGVPIVLQDMLSLLSGLLLGPLWGTLAVFVFLILGAIGLPVYSGKAGIMILISGPTGGFLIGYLLGAFFSGIFLRLVLYPGKSYKSLYKWGMCILGGVLGEVILFVSGIQGFIRVTDECFDYALKVCVIPFIPGMIIKTTLNILLAGLFRNKTQDLIHK